MKEIWRSIIEFENFYEISNLGRVRNKITQRIKVLSKDGKGYLRVGLFYMKDCTQTNFSVHRLVAQHFILNPENKKQVNHKDFDKANNHVENLEWVTNRENFDHAKRNGRIKYCQGGENHPSFKGEVLVFDLDGNFIQTLKGKRDMKEKGFCDVSVYKCLLGQRNKHKGCTFKRGIK